MIVGVAGKQVVIVMVQGPTQSSTEGSQWVQQQARMADRKNAGESVETNPSAQLLTDLYTVLMPHVQKEHSIIIGGDFNIHWGKDAKMVGGTFGTLEVWASALKLVHAARHRGHQFNTWKRADLPGSDETEPDHVFVSQTLADGGALHSIGAFRSHSVNNSDHFPIVAEISLTQALGLTDTGVRIDPPDAPARPKKLNTQDAKACTRFRAKAAAGIDRHALGSRVEEIEGLVFALERVKLEAGGEAWTHYATDLPGGQIMTALEAWWLDLMLCLTDAQTHAHEHPAMQATAGAKTKHNWSPTFKQLKEIHNAMVDTITMIDHNRCGHRTRDARLATTHALAAAAGRRGLLPTFPSGTHPPGLEVHNWCVAAKKAAATLLGELHNKKRNELRSGSSAWHCKVEQAIALNKWKALFRSELKKDYSSQAKHVVLADDPESGEGCVKLLMGRDEVNSFIRYFFARWMGAGVRKWFHRPDGGVHILHRNSFEGTHTRRALVRDTLTSEQRRDVLTDLPTGCDAVIHWWQRKSISVMGEQRRITDADLGCIDLMYVSPTDWIQCISKAGANKAADAHGMHTNLLKALLPPRLKKGETPDPAMESITERTTELLDLIRRALVAVISTGLIPECKLDQILCTIGKVAGSNDLNDTRPLTLIGITLNLLLGIQMGKAMHRLRELGAIDECQAGYCPGVGTDSPLLQRRLVSEHCWQYRKPLWLGDEDKRRAFDSPPECSLEMSMDRLAIDYRFILFVKRVGSGSAIRVRTAFGLTDPFGKLQGFPQGGMHSADLWTINDDPLCTAMSAEARVVEADPVVIEVPFSPPVPITCTSFCDDKTFYANTAEGMQRRYDMSTLWNRLNEVDTNVKKSFVQALIWCANGWLGPDSLPDITVRNWATGLFEALTKVEPHCPMKSLGMQTTAALFDGYAVKDATDVANRVGVCVAKGSVPDALWRRLISLVAERSAMYKIRTSSIGPNDVCDIHRRCHRAFKAKAGLCVTTPDLVVSSLVTLDWTSIHFCEQLIMIMKLLQARSNTTAPLIRSALQMHQLWQGGVGSLGTDNRTGRAWDSMLLGRLHDWMRPMNLELRGPLTTPIARQHDNLLIDLTGDPHDRNVLAVGSWVTEVWRVADCICWDGDIVTSLDHGGTWHGQIESVHPGMGSEWVNCVRTLLYHVADVGALGTRTRGSIRLGSVVCFPVAQPIALLSDQDHVLLALGRVVSDGCADHTWDDTVQIQLLRQLEPGCPEHREMISASSSSLMLKLPTAHGANTRHSGTKTRGALYAQCDTRAPVQSIPMRVGDLLEVKVVEVELKKACTFPDEVTTTLLLQLDEEFDLDTASRLWAEDPVPTPTVVETFEFPDKERVIGFDNAADMGWHIDESLWDSMLQLQAARANMGKRTAMLAVTDGSLLGESFDSRSTYGWLCHGVSLDGDGEHDACTHTGSMVPPGRTLYGGGTVDGPPEWSSSTRAEATGLLAALMGIITAGWVGDIEIRLDNDGAVKRAGGLVHTDPSHDPSASSPDGTFNLSNGLAIEDSDIWTEFAAWRSQYQDQFSATVTVLWHPGHPEERKRRDKADWNAYDHANFAADAIANDMHELPSTHSRTPTRWSHAPLWQLFWRGSEQTGCIAKRLKDIVRTEQLSSYLQSVGLGMGTDRDWLVPELVSRTVSRKEGDLPHKVFRAKVAACILGTMYTQLRRNNLSETQDAMCRMCGTALETPSHVLWECPHTIVAAPRRALVKLVRSIWRLSGLSDRGLATARLLWTLGTDDTPACTTSDAIPALLDRDTDADLLVASLIGHTLDPSGLFLDRAGFFGQGWVTLLLSLGLTRALALNTLASLSDLLQGIAGTYTIWTAFRAHLDTPEQSYTAVLADTSHGNTSLGATAGLLRRYDCWRLYIRDRLNALHVTCDHPYRLLSKMAARGITQADRDMFEAHVTDWLYASDCGWIEEASCYDDLMDAIMGAAAWVTACRRARGAVIIQARDIARQDLKDAALARRLPHVPPTAKRTHRPSTSAPVPRPKKRLMAYKTLHTGSKRDRRGHDTDVPSSKTSRIEAGPSLVAPPTAPPPDPTAEQQSQDSNEHTGGHKGSRKRKQHTDTAPGAAPPKVPKRAQRSSKRKAPPTAEQGTSKRPNKRPTAAKRSRSPDPTADTQGSSKKPDVHTTALKRLAGSEPPPQHTRNTRSKTRDAREMIQDLEPD